MAELKTQKNDASIEEFLEQVEDSQKKEDSKELLKIFTEVTKEKASMWGGSIVWFGSYHYKSDRSTQEWDWPLTGFSPRKLNISIYIMPGINNYPELLDSLGKCKVSKWSCLYIKRLSDIDIHTIKKLIKIWVTDMKKMHKTK